MHIWWAWCNSVRNILHEMVEKTSLNPSKITIFCKLQYAPKCKFTRMTQFPFLHNHTCIPMHCTCCIASLNIITFLAHSSHVLRSPAWRAVGHWGVTAWRLAVDTGVISLWAIVWCWWVLIGKLQDYNRWNMMKLCFTIMRSVPSFEERRTMA